MALVLIKYGVDHPIEKLKLACAEKDDCVVLIQDGVFWAVTDQVRDVKADVCALELDFCARGYPTESANVKLIDYSELVDLIAAEEQAIT
jgi:tRNA 2-thiouridine synthesizing protein B